MNNNIIILLCLTVFISCKSQQKMDVELEIKTAVFKTADYELLKPTRDSKAVLILFGGFGEKPADIKREFKIVDIAKKNQISLILMNYSNKLWLEEVENRKFYVFVNPPQGPRACPRLLQCPGAAPVPRGRAPPDPKGGALPELKEGGSTSA